MFERRKSIKGLRRLLGYYGVTTLLKYWVISSAFVTGVLDVGMLIGVYLIYKSCERV